MPDLKKTLIVTAGAYFAVLAIALSQRVLVWSDTASLAYASLKGHPDSPRGNAEVAALDVQMGNYAGAVEKLEHALTLPSSAKMGVFIQLAYTHCYFDMPGLSTERFVRVGGLPIDGTAYTATALNALNETYKRKPCRSFDYHAFIDALYKRFRDFYEGGRAADNPGLLMASLSTQMRLMEGLNYLGYTDKTLYLAEKHAENNVNHAGLSLLAAVAMIAEGDYQSAEVIVDQIRAAPDIPADFRNGELATVERALLAKMQER